MTTVASNVDQEASTLSALSQEMFATSHEITSAVQEVASGSVTQSGNLMDINSSIVEFDNSLDKFVVLSGGVNKNAIDIGSMASISNKKLAGLLYH